MLFPILAATVLLLHLAFILFALFGAAAVARWRWLIFLHIPTAAWGFFIEITERICPLTYLENYFRVRSGESDYTESFIEHYSLAIIYPDGLTRNAQFMLAGVVVILNVALYGWLFFHKRERDG